MRRDHPLGTSRMEKIGGTLGRVMDLLAHVYHQGEWWELNVWNPQLDSRIPQRLHEPHGSHVINFSHLTTPWLREATKWWLSRNLEREVYTWTTAMHHQHHLIWFQRYIDVKGCDGPHLLDDQRQLTSWVTGFREWLRQQLCTSGRNKGRPLGPALRRQAMTALSRCTDSCSRNTRTPRRYSTSRGGISSARSTLRSSDLGTNPRLSGCQTLSLYSVMR